MSHARGRNEKKLLQDGDNQHDNDPHNDDPHDDDPHDDHPGGIEAIFPHLSERLEAVGEEMREVFLVKAFLLLADAHGDVRTALSCLEEAATSGHGHTRDDESL